MNKILIALFAVIISTNIAYADYMPRFKSVNVRETPSINAPVIAKAYKGEKLIDLRKTIEDTNRLWLYIETINGVRGYVAEDVVDGFLFVDVNMPIQQSITKTNKRIANSTVIEGDMLHRVNISLKSLNRLTCAGKISDPIYSKDKEIEIVRGGENDLFIKISPVQTVFDGKTELNFNTFERELFVECLGKIYNITLIPIEELPTQTVIIKSSMIEVEHTRNIERSSAYEELISSLIKSAYLELAPAGYTMNKGNISYKFKELDMRLRYEYKGYDYIVEDWEVVSKSDDVTELEENIFIPYIKSPRAITFTTPRLSKGESTRLLVVRLNKGK